MGMPWSDGRLVIDAFDAYATGLTHPDNPPLYGFIRYWPKPDKTVSRRPLPSAAQRSHVHQPVRNVDGTGLSQILNLESSGSVLQITSAGFQFLLHSPHAQLWDLLLQYLHMAEVGYRFQIVQLSFTYALFRNGKWTWWKFSVSYLCFQQCNLAEYWLSTC